MRSLPFFCFFLSWVALSGIVNAKSEGLLKITRSPAADPLIARCQKVGCSCEKRVEGWEATCHRAVAFPSGLPAEITKIVITCDSELDDMSRPILDTKHLNRIPQNALRGLRNITDFTIVRCPIFELPPMFFANLTKLRKVSLESLLLVRLDGSLFLNSYNLERILLINMLDLQKIDPVLLHSQRTLSTVTLKRTKISGAQVAGMIRPLNASLNYFTWMLNLNPVTLPQTMFKGFRNLRRVILQRIQSDSLEFLLYMKTPDLGLSQNPMMATTPPFDFRRCTSLYGLLKLDLRNNNLRHFGREFSRFTNLRRLYLSNNQLSAVPEVIYTYLTLVHRLDLRSNKIQVFPQAMEIIFRNDNFRLMMEDNPLHCNCEARWLLRYPHFLTDLRCASPSHHKGKLLKNMRPEDLKCIPPAAPIILVKNVARTASNVFGFGISTIATNPMDETIIKYEIGKPISISRDQSLILRCDSSGDPAPELYWIYPWDATLKRLADPDRTLRKNMIETTILHRNLRNLTLAKIVCRAVNIAGKREASVVLKNLHPIINVVDPRTRTVTAQPSRRGPGGSATTSSASLRLLFALSVICSLANAV